jgi:hypothetical protein
MSRQFKLMILVNALLGFLFIAMNLIYVFGRGRPSDILWSPLWLTFYDSQALRTIGDLGLQIPNFSFYFFWISIIINVYFLYRLQRSKETKQNTT